MLTDEFQPDDFAIVHACAAGLDVHKMQITATIRHQPPSGAATTLTQAFSALPSGLAVLCAWLQRHAVDAALMEGTGVYWQAPFEALEDAGLAVTLVNAHQVKQLKGHKTDVADSIWLARVCQFGLTSPSMIPPRTFRDLRNLSRHRRRLVATAASVRNRVHKVLDRSGIRIGGVLTDIFGKNGRLIIDGLIEAQSRTTILGSLSAHVRRKLELLEDALRWSLSATDRALLGDLVTELDALDVRIEAFRDTLVTELTPWQRQLELLKTMPGVDMTAAADIFAELGPDLTVFGSAERLAAWAGVCPGNHESAGKRKPTRTRRGRRHLAAILNQCAHSAARTKDSQFHSYHKALMLRRGYKRAIVATAHKMLRSIWAILRDDTPYRDPDVDYDALYVDRNASRWLRQLEAFDYIQNGKVVWPTA